MNGTENCTFSNPVRYDNTPPTLPTHVFEFRTKSCTFTSTGTTTGTTNITLNAYNPTTTIASSTDVKIYGSISAGELLISLFLFILIWIKLLSFIPRALSNINTKKKFLGYNGGDVEIREDN